MSFLVIFLPCAIVVYVTVIALYLLDRLNSAERRLRGMEEHIARAQLTLPSVGYPLPDPYEE